MGQTGSMARQTTGARSRNREWLFLAMLLLAVCHARGHSDGPLLAYVGPGAGFAFLGSFLNILAALLLSVGSLAAWPFRMAWRLVRHRHGYRNARVKKLIFLGLDGLDPELAERYMAEGKLPHLARLRQEGAYRRLRTTFPALSPVAWSTFATGVNPARHNIFDFLNRDLRSYLPELSSSSVRGPRRVLRLGRYRVPLSRPSVEFRRKGEPFWKILGRNDIGCTILRVPISFPPEKFNGRMLSAMATPDLKGTQGSFSQFTTRLKSAEFENGDRYPLRREGNQLHGSLEGPADMLRAEGKPLRIPFRLVLSGGEARLKIQGRSLRLRRGEYTPWVKLTFRSAPGLKTSGIARFLLTESDPEVSLYVSPIQIDPESPALPISNPSAYAIYLAKALGLYATVGMVEDTWALNEGVIDEQAFLDQAYLAHAEREAMFQNALERTSRGVVACVFDATDRVQHMFFRYLGGKGGSPHAGAIEELYRRMDEMVGRTLRHVDSQTALFVLSDHGFRAFRRGVNLNAWLLEHGYLALEAGRRECGRYFEGVDWSRTRAYALGLGGLYLNVRGREASGVVPAERAAELEQELIAKLAGLRDEEHGTVAIRSVYAARAIYRGPYRDAAPDLIIGYADGYRTSWDGAVGKSAGRVIEDNEKAWSGDHCVDPPLVPGVLFSNRPVDAKDPGIEDMAATALYLFGLPRPAWMEGRSVIAEG